MIDGTFWLVMYVLWSCAMGCWEGYRSTIMVSVVTRAGVRGHDGSVVHSDAMLRQVRRHLLMGAVISGIFLWPLLWVARILRALRRVWGCLQEPWYSIEMWARWKQVPARLRRMSARQVEQHKACEALMRAFDKLGFRTERR